MFKQLADASGIIVSVDHCLVLRSCTH